MDSAERISVWLNSSSLDDIPLGIIRISTENQVVFANRAACDSIGPALAIGASIVDIFMDEESRHRLEAALERRFTEERGSDYCLTLHRPDLGTVVRVRV